MKLDPQILSQLSPKVRTLLDNQGTFERQFQMFIIDDEEERKIKAQETEEEVEITRDQKRRMLKCKRNLENNTRNLVRYLLKNEHDMTVIK